MPDTRAVSCDIASPEFWIARWRETLDGSPLKVNQGYATSRFWDTAAQDYDRGFDDHARARLDRTVSMLTEHGAAGTGLNALDIGCGTGRLAFALAEKGMDVTAIDFSAGMLDKLGANLPDGLPGSVHPRRIDWEAIDIDEQGWRGAFDLVIAHMTPAIRRPETFLKMIDCSRDACLIAGWAGRRTNSVLSMLWKHIMGAEMADRPSDIIFEFNLLYAMKYFPELSFQESRWVREKPLADVVEQYVRYFTGVSPEPEDALREIITATLKPMARDGMISESNHGRTGTIFWRVGNKSG